MTPESEMSGHWLGLCRRPPAVHALQMSAGILPEFGCAGVSGSGGGGPGAVRRGIGAALNGMRTLNRNRHLLWFTLLAGFVLAGNAVLQGAFRILGRILEPTHFAAGEGSGTLFGLSVHDITLSSLDFLLAFATQFCLLFLLAGLFLSIRPEGSGPATFIAGLAGAKRYAKSIVLWSALLALAAMLLFRIWAVVSLSLPPEYRFLHSFGPYFSDPVLMQFPFNWTLDWNMLTEIPGYGGRSLLLWIYPYGVAEALNFSAITLLLFLLTPFVVPLVIIGQKTLWEAVAGSVALIKKVWIEITACAAFLGIVVYGAFLSHLLIQAASGMVSPYNTVIFHPPDAWIAVALSYLFLLLTVAFIAATVGGIAALDLYTSAKSGRTAGSPESELQ